MMSDIDGAILMSIVLNLVKDGRADIAALSPAVQEYISGVMADFEETDEETQKMLYWFAHETLMNENPEIKGMLH